MFRGLFSVGGEMDRARVSGGDHACAMPPPPGRERTSRLYVRCAFGTRLSGHQPAVPKGSGRGGAARHWTGYTPAGQRVVVEREGDVWVVSCDDRVPAVHAVLDVALVEALRRDVEAHWAGIDQATWTRLIVAVILSRWPKNS